MQRCSNKNVRYGSLTMALVSGMFCYRFLLHAWCYALYFTRISSAHNMLDNTGYFRCQMINFAAASLITPLGIASSSIISSHVFVFTYQQSSQFFNQPQNFYPFFGKSELVSSLNHNIDRSTSISQYFNNIYYYLANFNSNNNQNSNNNNANIFTQNGSKFLFDINYNTFLFTWSLISFASLRLYFIIRHNSGPIKISMPIFRIIAPSDAWCQGSYATRAPGIAKSSKHVTNYQKELIQSYGKRYGCHHCGATQPSANNDSNNVKTTQSPRKTFSFSDYDISDSPTRTPKMKNASQQSLVGQVMSTVGINSPKHIKSPKNIKSPKKSDANVFIGDHVPPSKFIDANNQVSVAFFPQCVECSYKQANSVRNKRRTLLMPKFYQGTRIWHLWIPLPLLFVLFDYPNYDIFAQWLKFTS